MNFLISSPVLKAAAHTSEPFLDEFYNYLLVMQESALSHSSIFEIYHIFLIIALLLSNMSIKCRISSSTVYS